MSRSKYLTTLIVLATSTGPAYSECPFPSQLGGYLDGAQVVPPVQVSWEGLAILYACFDRLYGTVDLISPETITAVHIHGPALPGHSAPAIRELTLPTAGVIAVDTPLLPNEWDMIQGFHTYLDVHTTEHPDGAVRGWIVGKIGITSSPWSAIKRLYR